MNLKPEPEITPEVNDGDFLDQEIQHNVQQALQRMGQGLDLEASAQYSGALRRKRVVKSAKDLLRLVMVYSLTDWSLRMMGIWGTLMGVGSLSKNGVRKRLRQCQLWIGMLIVKILMNNKVALPQQAGIRVRLLDATCVSHTGSKKADWRLHLSFDLSHMRIDDVRLTTNKEGESLTRWSFEPNEICLADRCYGTTSGLGALMGAMAFFVIRIGWRKPPLYERDGQQMVITDWLRVLPTDPAAPPCERQVWVKTPQGTFPIRLIARAVPPDKAENARKRILAEAKKKKTYTVDDRSLLAAGFVIVVSNLPAAAWSSADILALYRFRWQVELVFKHLKSILTFDHLRSRDPQLAQVYLLTKILITLVLHEHRWRFAVQAPDSFSDPERPMSIWRLDQLLLEAFRPHICGQITLELIKEHLSDLKRYLQDEPRHRCKSLVSFFNRELVCGF